LTKAVFIENNHNLIHPLIQGPENPKGASAYFQGPARWHKGPINSA